MTIIKDLCSVLGTDVQDDPGRSCSEFWFPAYKVGAYILLTGSAALMECVEGPGRPVEATEPPLW